MYGGYTEEEKAWMREEIRRLAESSPPTNYTDYFTLPVLSYDDGILFLFLFLH